MKKRLAVLLAGAIAISCMGCGSNEAATTAAPSTAGGGDTTAGDDPSTASSDYAWPSMFVVNTTSSTSSAYSQTLAWASLVEKNTGMAVRLLPEDSNNTKFRRVRRGETDCMYDTITDVANLLEATNGFQTADGGPFAVRNLWIDNVQTAIIAVRGDSPIESIKDITTDTKIAYWADPSMVSVINGIAKLVGCESEDLNLISCSAYGDMIKMVSTGTADLCPYITPAASSLIEAAAGASGIKVLSFDPNQYPAECADWQEVFPNQNFSQVVSGYEGALDKYGYSNYAGFWTSADTDRDLVYNLFKYFIENTADIVPAYDSFQYYWGLETYLDFANTTPVAIHEGVVDYLKEIGKWTDGMQARQDYNVTLADWYTELYQTAIAEAQSKNITVGLDSPDWDALWAQIKADAGIPKVRIMSDEEIAAADPAH